VFFLAPHDFGVLEALGFGSDLVERERSDLLDTSDGDVLELVLHAVLEQLVVDLARTQDETLDLLGRGDALS